MGRGARGAGERKEKRVRREGWKEGERAMICVASRNIRGFIKRKREGKEEDV